jgi:PIN domain nuclease of toxin-antitoxin system
MNLLVDTHILLWSSIESPRLSVDARRLLESGQYQLWFSVLSLWEIALKRFKPRNDFEFEVGPLRSGLLSNGYLEMDIKANHISALQKLPNLHTDPFDRLLIAQAIAEGYWLLSSDLKMSHYGHPVISV